MYAPGCEQVLDDVTWTRYFNYRTVEYIFSGLSLSHYACNFFIFIPTGRHFREALLDVLLCRRSKTPNNDQPRRTTLTTIKTDSPRQSPAQIVRHAVTRPNR